MSRLNSGTSSGRVTRRQALRLGGLATLSVTLGTLTACGQAVTATTTAGPTAQAAAKENSAATVTSAAVTSATASAAPSSAAVPTGNVTLVYSTWGGSDWDKYNSHYIQVFGQQHTNVTIQYETWPWAQYNTKMLTMAAAGTAPDAYAQSNVYYPAYVSKGSALALDDFVKLDPSFDVADFIPTSLRLSTFKGKLYGLPHISSAWVRIWNKDLFKELSLASPDDMDKAGTWDWAGFLADAQKITQRDASGKAMRLGFGDPGLDYLNVHPWAWQNGADVLSQPDHAKFILNSPEGIAAIQFQADLLNKYKVSPLAGDLLKDSSSDFNVNRVAMFDSWANFAPLGFKDHRVGDVVYPAKQKQRASVLHTNSLGISSRTKIRDLCWQWISQLASKQGDLDQANFGIGIVLRKSNLPALENINRTQYNVEHPEVVTDVIQTGRTYDITAVYAEVEHAFTTAMDDVKLGKTSARDALNNVKPQIDSILAGVST